MSIEVLKPGLLTTVQDRGRLGYAALGVGTAGAMDDVALRLANALAGNSVDACALEITLIGPKLRFDRDATIALAGADAVATIDGAAMPAWCAVEVDAGAVLDAGTLRHGARAYLAIAGGFAFEATLGSASTDVNAALGPFDGRALREGDVLDVDDADRTQRSRRDEHASARWSLDPRPWFDADASHPIRLMRGSHFDALDAESRAALFASAFRVAADSNRVGFRLDGARLALASPIELASEPLARGVLQLPPGGQPIALMAEHPTIGGYARIGQIAAVDLARLAQRRSGDAVRFAEIDLDDAQTRYLERERALAQLIEAIGERLAT